MPSAGSADSATTAQNAANAANAANADKLGGKPASEFAPAQAEPVHVIGAPGEIAFGSGWAHASDGEEVPGFWKDLSGTVHLRGAAGRQSGTNGLIFTLPAGYRPDKEQWFITYGAGTTQAYVNVAADGSVVWQGGMDEAGNTDNSAYIGLGNITFRADQ